MNTFVFRPVSSEPWRKKIGKTINAIRLYHYRSLILMGLRCIVNFVLYAIIINITSTKGFFLSQAEKKTAQEEFRYNIVRFTLVSQQREVRQRINGASAATRIVIPLLTTDK